MKMNLNIMNKPCPSCKSEIEMGFWTIRENIRRCPECGVLLIENSNRKLVSGILFFIGGFVASGSEWLGIPMFIGVLIMIVSIIMAFKIVNFKIIEKDFVIKNKETNQISFINKSDWIDIENNSSDNENKFEIIERLTDNDKKY